MIQGSHPPLTPTSAALRCLAGKLGAGGLRELGVWELEVWGSWEGEGFPGWGVQEVWEQGGWVCICAVASVWICGLIFGLCGMGCYSVEG